MGLDLKRAAAPFILRACPFLDFRAPKKHHVANQTAERPQRWDAPFDPGMSSGVVASLLTKEPFAVMDAGRFPRHLPLAGLLQNDARLIQCRANQIVVREGDYGNSAFLVLSGSATVVLDNLPRRSLGRGQPKRRSLWRTLARALSIKGIPERRVHHTEREFSRQASPGVFLQDVPRLLNDRRTAVVPVGEIFGELAALGRTPRTATVIAAEDGTEILEIRWQGLRDLMNFAPEFNQQIEARFRENGLIPLLNQIDILQRVPRPAVTEIARATKLERYGSFDWYGSFRQMREAGAGAAALQSEPLIQREGDYVNGLLVIRGGFVRVSRLYNHSEQTVAYLGKGQHYGLREILHNQRNPSDPMPARYSLRAVGYVDVLLLPTELMERVVLPTLTPSQIKEYTPERERGPRAPGAGSEGLRRQFGPGVLEFFLDQRTLNGSATMLIDLDRCTRCDDCVRACASTHDGNPRFIRQGHRIESIQMVQACMHCHDPICMIPCPTGAIHRQESGQVVINDDTCIGCASCADNCPYDNIQMVEIRDLKGQPQYPMAVDADGTVVRDAQGRLVPQPAAGPILRATKCDLCQEHVGGPACERACPHDALVRMDMRDTDRLASWLTR